MLALALASIIDIVVCLCGCGGGGSNSGRGGGSPGPQIKVVAPTTVMERGPIPATDFLFYVYGSNFTRESQVFVDGQPANTTFLDVDTLKTEFIFGVSAVIGTHQLKVIDSSGTSNTSTFTAYWPQAGPQIMQALPSYLVGQEVEPNYVAVADVNGDGLADVIMQAGAATDILYGSADGTLAVNNTISGFVPWSLAVGDVDGDGTVDLVGPSSDNGGAGTTTVNVMLGDGHGNFQPAISSPPFPGIYPGPAQLVDLDGDGKLDLVLSVEQTPSGILALLWLKNEGGGNFAAPVTLAKATYDGAFVVADFNGDGKPDILYFYYNNATNVRAVHTLINKGSGSFKDEATPGLSGVSLAVINSIDFDLDGIPDLVVQNRENGNGVLMDSYKGIGDGSFMKVASQTLSPPVASDPFILVAGDFDHDGLPDLGGIDGEFEPSHVVYLYGDGTGNFTLREVIGPLGAIVAAGDINGDGIPDIVVPETQNFVTVALGSSDRSLTGPTALSPYTAEGISAGDINGDGLPEIFASGDRQHGIPGTVFLNQGNGSFQLAAATDPTSGFLADLTGKGVYDLLGFNGQDLLIWPNNGTLSFTSTQVTVPQVTDVAVADMDRDGHPDIVDVGRVLYGDSNYQFTQVNTNTTFFEPYAVGDFNGDGTLDIGTGQGTFLTTTNRTISSVGNQNRALPLGNGFVPAVADFNRDGVDDVAIIGPESSGVLVYYSYGDGTFYLALQLDAGQAIGDLTVGDFDGDGRPDIAVALMFSHEAEIFFNQANGQFTRSIFASGADATAVIRADLNHRGNLDLVIQNFMLDFQPPNVNVVFHK